MAERISCFVMSGGVGSRLWPLSREDNPKQFHDLSGDGSMLMKTVRRVQARETGPTPIHVIAAERNAARIRTELAGLQAAASLPGDQNLRQMLSDEALRCARGFAASLGAPALL